MVDAQAPCICICIFSCIAVAPPTLGDGMDDAADEGGVETVDIVDDEDDVDIGEEMDGSGEGAS